MSNDVTSITQLHTEIFVYVLFTFCFLLEWYLLNCIQITPQLIKEKNAFSILFVYIEKYFLVTELSCATTTGIVKATLSKIA